MNSLFTFRVNVHNIRSFQILSNSTKKTVRYGLKTLSIRSPSYGQICHKITNPELLSMASKQKRKCNVETCECRLCKHYEGNLGFI